MTRDGMRRDEMRKVEMRQEEMRGEEKSWDEKKKRRDEMRRYEMTRRWKYECFVLIVANAATEAWWSRYTIFVMSLSCLNYQQQHVVMRSLLLTRKLRVNLACSDDMFSVSGTTWFITIPKCIETECSLTPSCFLLLKALHIWWQNKVWPTPPPPPCSSVKLHAFVTLDNISIFSSQVSDTPTLNRLPH